MRSLTQLKQLFRQKVKVLPGGPANVTRGDGMLTVLDALAEEVKNGSYSALTLTAAQALQAADPPAVAASTLYGIVGTWNGAATNSTVYVQGVKPTAYHPLGAIYNAQGIGQLVQVDVTAGTYTALATATASATAVPFGPLTATGADGETFPLPAGTKSLQSLMVLVANPQPGVHPVRPLFDDPHYTIDTSANPPTLTVNAPYTLKVGDKIKGIAFATGSTTPPDGGGTTPGMPELDVDDQRNATLSAIPAGAVATDYDYQFRPVTVNGKRQADVSQMLGPDESPTDYDYQVR